IANAITGRIELARDRQRIIFCLNSVPASIQRCDFVAGRIIMHHGQNAEKADHSTAAEHDLRERRTHDRIHSRSTLPQSLLPDPCAEAVERCRHRAALTACGGVAGQSGLLDAPEMVTIAFRPGGWCECHGYLPSAEDCRA